MLIRQVVELVYFSVFLLLREVKHKANIFFNSFLKLLPQQQYIKLLIAEFKTKPIFDNAKFPSTNFHISKCESTDSSNFNIKKHFETHCQNSNTMNVNVTASNEIVSCFSREIDSFFPAIKHNMLTFYFTVVSCPLLEYYLVNINQVFSKSVFLRKLFFIHFELNKNNQSLLPVLNCQS